MYVDLAGLARYKQDFGAWARGALLPKDAAAARVRTAKAGAVSFYPVQQTPLDVSVDFLFTETPPASGDKSPENPSTISGVSSVKVTRCGKNILAPKSSETTTSKNVSITSNGDGSYTFNSPNGASTGQVFYQLPRFGENWFQQGVSFTFSCETESQSTSWQMWVANSTYCGGYLGRSPSVITPTKTLVSSVAIYIPQNATLDNVTLRPQIELGSVKTSFEKGVGNAYTINLGGTYYGGEIDLATGLMTVTWEAYKCTGSSSEGWFLDTVNSTSTMNYFRGVPQITHMMGNVSAATRACTHFVYSSTSSVVPSFATWSQTPRVVFRLSSASFPDVATLTSWLASEYNAGHPVTVAYALDQPYAVQLSPTEILSLTQSSDYDPRVNTVYSDASAVQAGYLKNPSAASSELRNALVSLGGGI